MRIKHSKYKNTGLIFELLVKQIASDTLEKRDSKAVQILKKYFTGSTPLVKEFKLYEYILKNRGIPQGKAESILSTVTEVSRKLDSNKLKQIKYNLIKELKEHYNLEDFFSIKVRDYKPLAAMYCLMEAQNIDDIVDPDFIVNNKVTLLEHLTTSEQSKQTAKDALISEYAKYDKDLKLLVYRVLLEKFNKKYSNLLPEQKNILKEFIVSVNSVTRLRSVMNEEMDKLRKELKSLEEKVTDGVTKIKLEQVLTEMKPIQKTKQVKDSNIVQLLQYYELVKELREL